MDVKRLSASRYRSMGTLCLDDDVILLEKTHSLFAKSITYQVDHVCIALVTQGEADFQIDGVVYHVKANDMFVIIQQQETKRLSLSQDFEARVLIMSRAYVEYLNLKNSYQMFLNLRRDPVVHLEGESLSSLETVFVILRNSLKHQDNPYLKQTIYYIIKAYIYGFAYYLLPYNAKPQTREEEVCNHFLALLESHFREEHSVGYYADRMHLTARYVSSCVKTITGRPAIDIIADKLMLYARKYLKNENWTISQISYELGFSNQSSFGKFFRAHEGIGPREYRNTCP